MLISIFQFFTVDFPSGVLEVQDDEIVEFISPKDLMIGQTIPMLARRSDTDFYFFLVNFRFNTKYYAPSNYILCISHTHHFL